MPMLDKQPSRWPLSQPDKLAFSRRLKRTVILGLGLFLLIALLRRYLYFEQPYIPLWPDVSEPYHVATTSDFSPVSISPNGKTMKELCESFPSHLLSRIQPVVRTGFTDPANRMSGHLDGVSACFKPDELLIFSDSDDTIGGHHVIDVLNSLPNSYHNLPDFQPYLELKAMRQDGSAKANPELLKTIDGWKIDKFKFLPAIEQAWLRKPGRDFYVFYESDTYVFWDSIFQFLQTLDPEVPLYLGSATPGQRDNVGYGTHFANGGPGYVISRGAMKKLLHRETDRIGRFIGPNFHDKWREEVTRERCGDSILGMVLWKSGIEMQSLYPMFTQHVFHTLPFDLLRWCSPIFTFHKPYPDQMRNVSRFEYGIRSHDHPIRYREVWEFYKPGTEAMRDNWRNNDVLCRKIAESAGITSRDECETHCRSLPKCLQWTWRGNPKRECYVGEDIIYYGEKQADSTSGWIVDRVRQWVEDHECKDTDWYGASLKRQYVPG